MNPSRSRNGSWTSSIVSTSSDSTAASACDADRPRGELLDDRGEQLAVRRVEALVVDLHRLERLAGGRRVDPAVAVDLGVVAGPLQQPVDDPRRAPAAARDRPGRRLVDLDVEDSGRSVDDRGELVDLVEVEPVGRAEPVTERRADPPRPGRRADDRERLEAEPEAPRATVPCRSSRRARSPPSPDRGSPRPRG